MGFDGKFFHTRISTEFLNQFSLNLHDLVYGINHMSGDSNNTSLFCDIAADRLPNPPSGIGAEFEPSAWIEFMDGAQQSYVSFLN